MNDPSPANERELPSAVPAQMQAADGTHEAFGEARLDIEYSMRAETDSDNVSSAETPNVESGFDSVNEAALAEASELLSQQIIGETPLVPPRAPLGKRLMSSVTRHRGVWLVCCVLLLWGAMTLRLPGANTDLEIGELASHDVIAPRATTILDREATGERREEAAALVTPEYDSELGAQSKAMSDLAFLLRLARRQTLTFQAQTAAANLPKTATGKTLGATNAISSTRNAPKLLLPNAQVAPEKARANFIRKFNASLRENGLKPLSPNTARILLSDAPMRWPILEAAARDGVRAAYFGDGHVQQIRSDADDDLTQAARRIAEKLNAPRSTSTSSTRYATLTRSEAQLAIALATHAARVPNLVVNARKTERAKREARAAVSAVYRNVVAGAVLVEAGTVIDANRWAQLQDLDLVSPRFDLTTALARLVLCAIAVAFAAVYIARTTPSVLASSSSLWLLALLPPLIVAGARGLLRVPFGEALLPPLIAFGAMSLAILLNVRVGLLCGLVTSLLCATVAREDSTSFAAIVLGAAVGALAVSDLLTRAHLVRATVVLSIAGALLAAIAGAMRETPLSELGSLALFAGGSHAVAVWLAAGFAMFLERPLGITTHLSLLELSSPDEPVMRRMQSEAPGTYTHSLMVAQLSEAGAKAVGADPLLCRVGGLYHDVGKLRRPHCFIENQSGVNVHDRLTPQLSALLIIAHVKDGLELARALRLPRPIHDIIQQHHGTDLVAYFYHRAQQAAQLALFSSTESGVNEANFRYSGPRPQSKEAAIVMLADSVEASSRALPDLTPEKLEAHIKSMIAQRLRDDQLAECELTMCDLTTMERAFAHVLRGALHQRIEYPDPSRELKETARDETAWTSQAMRDPNSETPRRRAERPKTTREKATTNGSNANGATKTVALKSEATSKSDETVTAAPRNTLRKNRFASFAAHFSHARSSPVVVASDTVSSEPVSSEPASTEPTSSEPIVSEPIVPIASETALPDATSSEPSTTDRVSPDKVSSESIASKVVQMKTDDANGAPQIASQRKRNA